MINVKDQIYAALCTVIDNVSDIYPKQPSQFPFIFYAEEQNSVYEWTDDKEQLSQLRYRIEIWAESSTSELALHVDSAVSKLGLRRTSCQDLPDPEGRRCKQMRYEGIIDVNTEQVYQENL